MAIVEGLAAARLAFDAGAKGIDLLRYPKIDGDAVRNKITEMQDLVLSVQRALGEAEEENRQLRRQLDDREQLKALETDLEFLPADGYYIRKSEREAGLNVPYCPVCWDKTPKQLIHLNEGATKGVYGCRIEGSSYWTAAYRSASRDTSTRRQPRSGGPQGWMGS